MKCSNLPAIAAALFLVQESPAQLVDEFNGASLELLSAIDG